MRWSSIACARSASRPISTRRLASVLNSMCGSSCDSSSRSCVSAAWRRSVSAWASALAIRWRYSRKKVAAKPGISEITITAITRRSGLASRLRSWKPVTKLPTSRPML